MHGVILPAQYFGQDLGAVLGIHLPQKAGKPLGGGVVVQRPGQAFGALLGGGVLRHGAHQCGQGARQNVSGILFAGAGLPGDGGDHAAGKQIGQIHLISSLSRQLPSLSSAQKSQGSVRLASKASSMVPG